MHGKWVPVDHQQHGVEPSPNDVVGVVGLEVGSEFFVQNLCTLIGAESLWVPTEVRDKAFVTEDEVILGVHKFNVL